MKPIIFYVDDEPLNLTVFEAALPSDWEIRTFTSPALALQALNDSAPWVMVSDQRMPELNGVQFFELAKKLRPDAVRVIVTGYSDESLVIDSVRRAQVYDYITKPWEPDHLEASLRRAIESYRTGAETKRLGLELAEREARLAKQNQELLERTKELEQANSREQQLRSELECWVPRPLLMMLQAGVQQLPVRRDIVGINFDIIDSSKIHGLMVGSRSVREHLVHAFSQCVLRFGGWRESHSGDSAYGHFGLWEQAVNPFQAAFAAAREFRVTLRALCEMQEIQVECGIGLHLAKSSLLSVHTVQIETSSGKLTQKSFDTTSLQIDLLHRIEKLAHHLPGSNIVMTQDFLEGLAFKPEKLEQLGAYIAKGQDSAVELFLIPSDKLKEQDLERLRAEIALTLPNKKQEKKVA